MRRSMFKKGVRHSCSASRFIPCKSEHACIWCMLQRHFVIRVDFVHDAGAGLVLGGAEWLASTWLRSAHILQRLLETLILLPPMGHSRIHPLFTSLPQHISCTPWLPNTIGCGLDRPCWLTKGSSMASQRGRSEAELMGRWRVSKSSEKKNNFHENEKNWASQATDTADFFDFSWFSPLIFWEMEFLGEHWRERLPFLTESTIALSPLQNIPNGRGAKIGELYRTREAIPSRPPRKAWGNWSQTNRSIWITSKITIEL